MADVVCIHPDRPRYGRTPWCVPCYLTRVWHGQSSTKDGVWAAYRREQQTNARNAKRILLRGGR